MKWITGSIVLGAGTSVLAVKMKRLVVLLSRKPLIKPTNHSITSNRRCLQTKINLPLTRCYIQTSQCDQLGIKYRYG